MFARIKNLVLSDTGRDTSIVFTGTIINAVTGGIFFIVAPRVLGPANYGLFAVVTATAFLINGFANLGIPTGILKFTNQNDQELAQKILKLAFEVYVAIGVLIFFLGFLFAQPLADFLGKTELTPLFRIAFAGTILFLVTEFFTATLQARKQYVKSSVVYISSNVARILVLFFAIYFKATSLYFFTIIFFAVPLVSVFLGKIYVSFDFLSAQNEKKEFNNFFRYNFWIAASFIISSIPFNSYLLLKFAGPLATGLYAAPYKFLTIVDQLSGNFSRVLAPRFSSFQDDSQAISYSKKAVPIVIVVSLGLLVLSFLAGPITKLLLGDQYSGSIVIFRIVSLSYAFYFADTIAVSLIVYYFARPKISFTITASVILIWGLTSVMLIPRYHEIGAAISDLVSGIAAVSLFTLYAVWRFKSHPDGKP